jgi:hypothetical protein
MTFYFLLFEWFLSAFIGAGDRVLVTLQVVELDHILKSGPILSAVLTGKRPLHTLLGLVDGYVASLETLPAIVHAFYLNKLTGTERILWREIWVQVQFKLSQFSLPIATSAFVSAPNFKMSQVSLQPVITYESEIGLVAQRTWLIVFFYSLDTLTTELLSARTADEAGLSQDEQTDGAFGLNGRRRRLDKLTVVPATNWGTV